MRQLHEFRLGAVNLSERLDDCFHLQAIQDRLLPDRKQLIHSYNYPI